MDGGGKRKRAAFPSFVFVTISCASFATLSQGFLARIVGHDVLKIYIGISLRYAGKTVAWAMFSVLTANWT